MKTKLVYLLGLLAILSPIIIWIVVLGRNVLSYDPADWAIFANYLSGTVNIIITFLGFFVIILTYKKQVNDSKSQAHDSYVIAFENTLFKMNEYNHLIKDSIIYNDDIKGVNAINRYAVDICNFYLDKGNKIGNIPDHFIIIKKYINETYPNIYGKFFYKLGHYFRHLYSLYKYIDQSKLTDNEKTKYAKIIRAEMSTEEMLLLGFNGMTLYGEKFSSYIEKYELLHRLMNMNYWGFGLLCG